MVSKDYNDMVGVGLNRSRGGKVWKLLCGLFKVGIYPVFRAPLKLSVVWIPLQSSPLWCGICSIFCVAVV